MLQDLNVILIKKITNGQHFTSFFLWFDNNHHDTWNLTLKNAKLIVNQKSKIEIFHLNFNFFGFNLAD